MMKQKNIRDRMRYSNLSNNMMQTVNNNYSSNTVVKQVLLYVDRWVVHVTDTTLHQSIPYQDPPLILSPSLH